MNEIMKTWLEVQSKRRKLKMADEKPIKAFLKQESETYEVRIHWLPNFAGEPIMLIYLLENTGFFNNFMISDSNTRGIAEYERENKIVVNGAEQDSQLELTFMSHDGYTKALKLIKKILR